MNRQSNNFGELHSFKTSLRREKTNGFPKFDGVKVKLIDCESGVEFTLPVLMVKSMRPTDKGTLVRLVDGTKHHVEGTVQNVCHAIIKAKIEGGHD